MLADDAIRNALKGGKISLLELGSLSSSSDEDDNFSPLCSTEGQTPCFSNITLDGDLKNIHTHRRTTGVPSVTVNEREETIPGAKNAIPTNKQKESPTKNTSESGILPFEANLGPPPALPEAICLPVTERLQEIRQKGILSKGASKSGTARSPSEGLPDPPVGFNGSSPRMLNFLNPLSSLKHSEIYATAPQGKPSSKSKKSSPQAALVSSSPENEQRRASPHLRQPKKTLRMAATPENAGPSECQYNANPFPVEDDSVSHRTVGIQCEILGGGNAPSCQQSDLSVADKEKLPQVEKLQRVLLEGSLIEEIQQLEASLRHLKIPESLYDGSLSSVTRKISSTVEILQKTSEEMHASVISR